MSLWSSLKEYTPTLNIKESLGLGAGDAKALAALTESDKEFEEKVRKTWHLMHSLVSALHENLVKANTNFTDMSRPIGNAEHALSNYFRECHVPSEEVKEFSASVQKLKVATHKYGEMMTSYRVKEELEDWLAKLGEIKRQITARDNLLIDYKKKQQKHESQRAKAEQKHTTREPAVAQKLKELESDYKTTRDQFVVQNTKLIKQVPEFHQQLFKVLEDQIRTAATSHFWLFWTLSEAYGYWHQQEVNKAVVRQTRRTGATSTYRRAMTIKALPQAPSPQSPEAAAASVAPAPTASATTSAAAEKALPTPPAQVLAKPLPVPGQKKDTPTPPAKPAPQPTEAPQTQQAQPAQQAATESDNLRDEKGDTVTERSLREKVKLLALERKSLDQDKAEVERQRQEIRREWDDVEVERQKLRQLKKDELAKLAEEKARNEAELREKIRLLEERERNLENDRRALESDKLRLEKRIQEENERAEKRRIMEEEFKKMDEERKAIEEKKLQIAEEKMRKRLQEEWKRIEDKKKELEEARKQEEDRRRKEEEDRIEEERKRLEFEAKERERREEEARLEEQREKDRIERIRRQMEDEKMRLEKIRKRLLDEDEDAEVEFFVSPSAQSTTAFSAAAPVQRSDAVESTQTPAPTGAAQDTTAPVPVSVVKTEARKTMRRTVRQTRRVMVVKAKYDYEAKKPEELSFRKGDVLLIDFVVGNTTGWVRAQTEAGAGGLIPESFVEKFSEEDDESKEEEKELKAKEEEWKREQEAEKARELEREKERERKRVEMEAAAASTEQEEGDTTVRALYDYHAQEEGELTFKKGDLIKLLERDDEGGWWIGDLRGIMGLFPKNFVEIVNPAELRSKADDKKKPFGGIKLFPDSEVSSKVTQPATTQPQPAQTQPQKKEEPKQETTVALYDYEATDEGELSFKQGDVIGILQKFENGWWRGEVRGQIGVFPVNFTKAA